MHSNYKLVDLTLVLKALHQVRQEWLATVEKKAQEMVSDKPGMSIEVARNEALTHPDIFEVFQRLMTLYSCVGQDAEAYIAALDSVEPTADVIPFKKAG